MPPFDLSRLRRDLKRRSAERAEAAGRRGHGSMALVREHLDAFEQLHRDGASWVDIAAALAAQGVMQGSGASLRPITGKRLTALIASVRRERVRRAAADRVRAQRSDLDRARHHAGEAPDPVPSSAVQPLALSSDLAAPHDPDGPDPLPSAEDMRLKALAAVQKLLRKDPA